MSSEIFQGMMGAQVDRERNISGMTGAKLTDMGIFQGVTGAMLTDMGVFQEWLGSTWEIWDYFRKWLEPSRQIWEYFREWLEQSRHIWECLRKWLEPSWQYGNISGMTRAKLTDMGIFQGMPGTKFPDALLLVPSYPPSKAVIQAFLDCGYYFRCQLPVLLKDYYTLKSSFQFVSTLCVPFHTVSKFSVPFRPASLFPVSFHHGRLVSVPFLYLVFPFFNMLPFSSLSSQVVPFQ